MVTVCVVTNDNYWLSRYSIENLLSKSRDVEMELFIYDNGSSDKRIIEYAQSVADKFYSHNSITSNSFCYNEMMKDIGTEWICVFPVGIMVNEFWLSDLVTAMETVHKSGVGAIHAYGDRGNMNPLLTHQDSMKHIWSTLDGGISGILLFNLSVVRGIGGFDKNIKLESLAQKQFCWRVKHAGRHTFFIHEQSATDTMNRINEPNPEDIASYDTNIGLLKTSKNFRIDL